MKAKSITMNELRFRVMAGVTIWFIAIIAIFGIVGSAMVTAYAAETMDVCEVALANTDDGVELTWNLIEGAESYEIYRKTENGDYIKVAIADATENSWVDESVSSGTTYTYYVKPVSEDETWGYEIATITHMSTGINRTFYMIIAIFTVFAVALIVIGFL